MKRKLENVTVAKISDSWISVTDNQPEYGVPVLVCQKGNEDSIQICRLQSVTERKDKEEIVKWYEWLEGRHGYDSWYYDVTHWKQLSACR